MSNIFGAPSAFAAGAMAFAWALPAAAQTQLTLEPETCGFIVATTAGSSERFACPVRGDDPRAALANGAASTAFGARTRADGDRSTALGNAAAAAGENSVALGAGSVAAEANVVSIGAPGSERRLTNLAPGSAATDAVNLGQMTAAIGDLAAVQQRTADTLFDLRRIDRRDARKGVAAAVAMSTAPMPSSPGRTSYVLNAATFRGEQAMGGSIMYRLNTSKPFAIGAGFSFAGDNNNAARVGVAGEF